MQISIWMRKMFRNGNVLIEFTSEFVGSKMLFRCMGSVFTVLLPHRSLTARNWITQTVCRSSSSIASATQMHLDYARGARDTAECEWECWMSNSKYDKGRARTVWTRRSDSCRTVISLFWRYFVHMRVAVGGGFLCCGARPSTYGERLPAHIAFIVTKH